MSFVRRSRIQLSAGFICFLVMSFGLFLYLEENRTVAKAQAMQSSPADELIPNGCITVIPGQGGGGSTPEGVDLAASTGCLWGRVYVNGQAVANAEVTLSYTTIANSIVTTTTNTSVTDTVFVFYPDSLGARYAETATLSVRIGSDVPRPAQVIQFLPDFKTQTQRENLVFVISDVTLPPKPAVISMSVQSVVLDGDSAVFSATASPGSNEYPVVRYLWHSDKDNDFGAHTARFTYRSLDLRHGVHQISVQAQDPYGQLSDPMTATLLCGRHSRRPSSWHSVPISRAVCMGQQCRWVERCLVGA